MKSVHYDPKTPPEIVKILEDSRRCGGRVRITFKDGKRKTGIVTWADIDDVRFPLLVREKNSLSGNLIPDWAIEKVERA